MNENYDDYKLHLVGEQTSRDAIRHYRPEEFKARSFRTSKKMENPKLSPSDIVKKALVTASIISVIGGGVAVINNVQDNNISNEQIVFSVEIPSQIANKTGVKVEVDSNGNATIVDENGKYGSLNNISAMEYASMLGYNANINSNNQIVR
ncbi:MAG: hypothetical protein IKF01_01350 [Bacilli bacterium]|nr:hypothetical protein [Bacilli bacterium]